MLHRETVEQGTLDLLIQLMSLDILKPFSLVGGTALALQMGHRRSTDLDFFGDCDFNPEQILQELGKYGSIQITNQNEIVLQFILNKVKIDVVNYKYKPLEPAQTIEGIRLLGFKDIAAMKLSAIGGRGKKRDFYDLYFLLKHYSLQNIVLFCEQKFPETNLYHLFRSLTYFDEAETDSEPVILLNDKVTWDQVKQTILKEARKILV
jgi:predicted nucleotidyltransferase component of viral defense system